MPKVVTKLSKDTKKVESKFTVEQFHDSGGYLLLDVLHNGLKIGQMTMIPCDQTKEFFTLLRSAGVAIDAKGSRKEK